MEIWKTPYTPNGRNRVFSFLVSPQEPKNRINPKSSGKTVDRFGVSPPRPCRSGFAVVGGRDLGPASQFRPCRSGIGGVGRAQKIEIWKIPYIPDGRKRVFSFLLSPLEQKNRTNPKSSGKTVDRLGKNFFHEKNFFPTKKIFSRKKIFFP